MTSTALTLPSHCPHPGPHPHQVCEPHTCYISVVLDTARIADLHLDVDVESVRGAILRVVVVVVVVLVVVVLLVLDLVSVLVVLACPCDT